MESYWYSYGHKTRAAAEIALEIAWNSGDVLPGENPRVEAYRTKDGAKRYGVRVSQAAVRIAMSHAFPEESRARAKSTLHRRQYNGAQPIRTL